ncbi:hypothetical protein VMCG_09239 [Cytospora schulzeri]|uniref:R3H-associated N-terminal domain-containing protein n=1 Tax=Cytospora schulzeri TaxID=448051 RepID=A0A423VL62_9PEZI|nr:hypothetical protein VMCG_09239 [Valsa malicola]
MAIYSAVPPPEETTPPHQQPSHTIAHPQNIPQHFRSASGTIDIEAWTISALESLSVSSPIAPGTGPSAAAAPLTIPLDDDHHNSSGNTSRPGANARVTIAVGGDVAAATGITPPRRPPSRRDSMRRREALLKGKEGSRQRRRWDMKRLSDLPYVEPPLDEDYEPRPVYPIRHIPYHVATFWDRGLRQQVEDKNVAAARRKKAAGNSAGKMPRDLRETVRRSPGIKGWVRSLEEPVREFLAGRGDNAAGGAGASAGGETDEFEDVQGGDEESESDVSDDEVVFVGRKGAAAARDRARPDGWKKAHREVHDRPIDRGMIFDSLGDDESGAFKRWLTHSISDYYGLDSRSVTMGDPARRCVYIGIREAELRMAPQKRTELPRPLWELF